MRAALRSAGRKVAAGRAAHGSTWVVCSGGGGGGRLTPEQHKRAFSVLSNTRLLDWKQWGSSLGGTLIVDDASHKEDVQRALREGTLSFGFSAGGCLFPYYIGCAGALIDAGILTDQVKLGGASAGSLLAACIKSGMPLDDVVDQNLRLMDDLRRGGTRGRLGAVLKAFLQQHLPEDAHEKCRERAYVAVTKVTPIARPVLVSAFLSREDLIQALMTSCHIPFWLDGNPFTDFRGSRHCDGGLTNFIPLPPQTVGVRVCCFPSKQLSPVYRIGISPDSFEPWDYSLRQMVQWAFEPADEATVAALIDKGKEDAQAWMESMDLVGEAEAVEAKEQRDVGAVAASKEAAVGAGGAEHKERAQEEGWQRLEERAQEGGAGAAPLAAAPEAAAAKEQQAAGGEAAGAQREAVEAVAAAEDAGASREEQEAEAERALKEAEEREGEGGNIWARALGAAGVAASAAAVAAAVAGGGV
ncbi:hypothetical protein ABPG75_012626 [Micractinium tetrahymenae]